MKILKIMETLGYWIYRNEISKRIMEIKLV